VPATATGLLAGFDWAKAVANTRRVNESALTATRTRWENNLVVI
jgi:hypothetical protein